MPSQPNRIAIAILILTLSLFWACGRPPAENSTSAADSEKLPFDRAPHANGISPSQTLVPSATKLPEGTAIPVRLATELSSASSHAGDTFSAFIDEPVAIDGQKLVARGTPATGRVLEAKPSANSPGSALGSSLGSSFEHSLEPGYLRIVLVSLNLGGRQVMIETSSIFAKGGSREERNPPPGAASGAGAKDRDRDRDIVFGTGRRLNFRLAQAVDLQ
jgi:hypothetical protein